MNSATPTTVDSLTNGHRLPVALFFNNQTRTQPNPNKPTKTRGLVWEPESENGKFFPCKRRGESLERTINHGLTQIGRVWWGPLGVSVSVCVCVCVCVWPPTSRHFGPLADGSVCFCRMAFYRVKTRSNFRPAKPKNQQRNRYKNIGRIRHPHHHPEGRRVFRLVADWTRSIDKLGLPSFTGFLASGIVFSVAHRQRTT